MTTEQHSYIKTFISFLSFSFFFFFLLLLVPFLSWLIFFLLSFFCFSSSSFSHLSSLLFQYFASLPPFFLSYLTFCTHQKLPPTFRSIPLSVLLSYSFIHSLQFVCLSLPSTSRFFILFFAACLFPFFSFLPLVIIFILYCILYSFICFDSFVIIFYHHITPQYFLYLFMSLFF